MSDQHWTVEEGRKGWLLRYDPTPGGTTHDDGSTTVSLTFPALELTEWVSDQERVASELARELNAFPALLDALKALLACPAIADGGLTDPEWGCQESAEAVAQALTALAKAEGAEPCK